MSENEIQLRLENGKRLYERSDYELAIEEYRLILERFPDDEQALFETGKTHFALKRYDHAKSFFMKTIEINPKNEHARLLLSKTYRIMERYDDSLNELFSLKKINPKNSEVAGELKSVQAEKYSRLPENDLDTDYKTAKKEYMHGIEENPANEKLICHLAQVCNYSGDYENTVQTTERYLKTISDSFFKNKLLNELEIAGGKTVLNSGVRSMAVTLSNKCNLNCIMCLTRNVKWDIPKKNLEEIVALFPSLEKVMWQGGEVFTLDYFMDLFGAGARYPHLKQSIVTNGLLITEEIAHNLIENDAEITFSVDGITKDVYENIRKGGDFGTLIKNLRYLSGHKKNCGSRTIMNLNVAVMKSNYRQLADYIDFAKEYGFEFICFMPIHIHLKTPQDIFSNHDTEALTFITDVMPVVLSKAKRYGIRIEERLPKIEKEVSEGEVKKRDSLEKGFLCHIPWQQMFIEYDGTVRPDCLCSKDICAGPLDGQLSLLEIWNGRMMQEYRKRIIERDVSVCCNANCVSGRISKKHLKVP